MRGEFGWLSSPLGWVVVGIRQRRKVPTWLSGSGRHLVCKPYDYWGSRVGTLRFFSLALRILSGLRIRSTAAARLPDAPRDLRYAMTSSLNGAVVGSSGSVVLQNWVIASSTSPNPSEVCPWRGSASGSGLDSMVIGSCREEGSGCEDGSLCGRVIWMLSLAIHPTKDALVIIVSDRLISASRSDALTTRKSFSRLMFP